MTARNASLIPDRETAETIALTALAFITADGQRLGRFLGTTGLTIEELRERAASGPVLQAVLEHLAEDESLLLVFAASTGLAPESIAPARAVLAGAPTHGGWGG